MKRRREALRRELGILGENLLLRRAARCELEEELNAQASAANTGLAAQRSADRRR